MEVTCKMMRQGNNMVWVYSYHILDKKGKRYYFGNDSKKPKEPLLKPVNKSELSIIYELIKILYTEEELEALHKSKQHALHFLMKYNYQSKFLHKEPPAEKICRIKVLNVGQSNPTF